MMDEVSLHPPWDVSMVTTRRKLDDGLFICVIACYAQVYPTLIRQSKTNPRAKPIWTSLIMVSLSVIAVTDGVSCSDVSVVGRCLILSLSLSVDLYVNWPCFFRTICCFWARAAPASRLQGLDDLSFVLLTWTLKLDLIRTWFTPFRSCFAIVHIPGRPQRHIYIT